MGPIAAITARRISSAAPMTYSTGVASTASSGISRRGAFWPAGCKRRGKRASLVKLLLKPFGKFLETYVLKRGFLDGMAGFIISVNAAHSMFLKYAYLIEAEIPASASPDRR